MPFYKISMLTGFHAIIFSSHAVLNRQLLHCSTGIWGMQVFSAKFRGIYLHTLQVLQELHLLNHIDKLIIVLGSGEHIQNLLHCLVRFHAVQCLTDDIDRLQLIR